MSTADRFRSLPGWIKIGGVCLAVLAVVLFVLDQRETRELQQQALDQQARLIQQQQAALDQQQAVVEKQLQAAGSLAEKYEGHLEQQKAEQEMAEVMRTQHMNAAYMASGLSLASRLKPRIMEHYMMEGRFPESNGDVGLPDPDRMGSHGVRSVGITEEGGIEITYGPETGIDGGVVLLSPTERAQAGRVDWNCTTPDYPDIARFLPTCQYEG